MVQGIMGMDGHLCVGLWGSGMFWDIEPDIRADIWNSNHVCSKLRALLRYYKIRPNKQTCCLTFNRVDTLIKLPKHVSGDRNFVVVVYSSCSSGSTYAIATQPKMDHMLNEGEASGEFSSIHRSRILSHLVYSGDISQLSPGKLLLSPPARLWNMFHACCIISFQHWRYTTKPFSTARL